MSKKIKRIIGLIVCLALSLCFFACSGEDIKISGKNRVTLQAGQTYDVPVSGLTGTDVEWKSSDETVATVSGGKVLAISQGEAVITVSEGKKSASVTIVVRDNRSYSVTVVGVDTYKVGYGEKIAKPADPVKAATAQYTYTFKGWYAGGQPYDFNSPVTANIVIEPVFDRTVNKYTVTVGDVQQEYEYGSQIVLEGELAAPTKEATAEYSYLFIGYYDGETKWDFANGVVTGDVTLTAKFQEIKRQYAVTFNGKAAEYYEYGAKLTAPAAPEKAATAQYTYVFKGWYVGDKKWNFDVDTVTETTELVAKYDEQINTYTVVVGDKTQTLDYGSKIAAPATPEKAATAKYTYTFAGWITEDGKVWDFAKDTVTGPVTLTASFNATVNQYDVIIPAYTVLENGEYKQIAASTQKVTFGEKVARPATPAKEGKDGKSYYFDKFVVKGTETEWNFEKDVVEGNVELEVLFKECTDKFLVSFDGIRFEEYAYGEKIVRPETDPVKEPSVTTEYLFMGWTTEDGVEWDFDTDVVTENVKLIASFGEKDRVYVIKFVVDGQELEETQEVKIGRKIEQPEGTPEKAPTKTKTYTFTGWYNGQEAWDFDKAIEGPVTLTARFAESVRKYTVTFETKDGTTTAQYVYGARIDRPEDAADYIDETLGKKAVFVGWTVGGREWDFIGGTVTADVTLTAKYEFKDISYNVTYLDENGALLFTHSVKNAGEVIRLAAHEKATDARFVYTFIGWTADNETIYDFTAELTADVVLTPVYEQSARIYTVTLVNYDGSVFKVLEGETGYTYGEKFYYPIDADQPIKEIGDENSYVFDHWAIKEDGEAFEGEVIGNMILRAVYIIDNNLYTVKYYDYDGNLIEDATQNSIKRNKLLVLPDMEKAATLEEKYIFLGWATEKGGAVRYPASNALIRCSGNMEMYSVYKTEIIYYTVTASVTDEDNTYYITDKNGNVLTADDLSFTYNTKFEFKLAINTESMGSVAVNLNGNPLYANEDGVYSLYVRDNNNRIAITGLTIRRYTITGAVAIAKQNDEIPMIIDESDVIVKLTDGDEVRYIEDAVNGGVLEINALLKGDYTVEFVTRNAIGEFSPISTLKYVQALNADWAVANDTMTWTLERSLVGLEDVTVSNNYKMDANGVVSPVENVMRNNLYVTVNGANPGEGDFIASVSYDKCDKTQTTADGPSFGFTFWTESGVNLSVYFVDEGKIRIVGGPVLNWEPGHSPYQSGKLVCGVGAVGNMYGDCYRLVTVTFVKKDGNLYLFGSFADKYYSVVPVSNKLMGYIDTATGTVYTAEIMAGSSQNQFANRLHPTGEYQTYQHDEFKRLANITGMSADYGITQVAPVDVYGVRYSELPEDIDTYFARTETRFETTLDNHASLLVKNPTGSKTAVSVFNEATFTVVPDPGYRIKSVEFEGDYYPYYFNEKGQLVFEFRKDLGRYGSYKVNVVTEKGGIEGWTKYSGAFTIEGTPTDKAVAVFVGIDNAFVVGLYGDAEGKYSTYLPAGAYFMVADTQWDTAGYAYNDIATPVTYRQLANIVSDGGALTKNVDFALMTGGLSIGAGKIGYSDVTWDGTCDKDFTISVHSYSEHSYFLNRKLADGQMISYSLKFNENQGKTASGANEANAQDLYIKNTVGGQNLGMNSYGDRWGGDAVKTSPVRGLKQTLQQGFYNNVYNFAYARTGNTVYMLIKYEGAEDWVAVSKVNVTDAQAQIRLHISGAGARGFDYTYSNFAFNGNATEVNAIITAASGNKSTTTIRDIGTPGADGKYDTFIEGNYGLVITDQTFSKSGDVAVITATVHTRLQKYPFFGFVMRDPETGNFVNIGMNSTTNTWRSSLGDGNGWTYRTAALPALWDIPFVNIGDGNTANPVETDFTIKAVVVGDFWTISVNGNTAVSLDLRRYYEDYYIGGGATASGAASGNAKHPWTNDTEKLFPTGDKYQLGFYAFADTVSQAIVKDITLTKSEREGEMLVENANPLNVESVKNTADIDYNMYRAKGNARPVRTAKVAEGEAIVLTLKYNAAGNGKNGHQQKIDTSNPNNDGGDHYTKFKLAGQSLGFNNNGAAYGTGVVTGNTFDFGFGRDGWGLTLFNKTEYELAVAKVGGKAKLYGRIYGATEWKEIFSIATSDQYVFIDNFEVVNRGECAMNASFTHCYRVAASEITSHMNSVGYEAPWGFGSTKYNEDGSAAFYAHVTTAGQQQKGAAFLPYVNYTAKDNTVVITGDYAMLNGGANESQFGWNFVDSNDKAKNLYFSIVPFNGSSKIRVGWNSFRNNGYGRRYTLYSKDEVNGLYAYNPAPLALANQVTKTFSAKWVVNNYRYTLYVGEYGKEATTLVLD
ncbi:MAG: InlB B-repeat-containing protein, partial [Candidatus Neoclostridium sp.]